MQKISQKIEKRILELERPQRKALSLKYPKLKGPIMLIRQTSRNMQNTVNWQLSRKRADHFLDYMVYSHQSVLIRRLGNSDIRLQKQKITNLLAAAEKLNGLVIPPGKTFSFWHAIGKPSRKDGFVNGMILSNGKVAEGLGGGLCQMSNLLFWLFLHAPVEITERHHHSKDIFPDSGRVLPFGSGATIVYNFIDLRVKNTSEIPMQLKIWLTDKHLKGKILAPEKVQQKPHIIEKNHCFVKRDDQYFRFNEIWRTEQTPAEQEKEEKLITNLAPVLYEVDDQYIDNNNYSLLHI